jgi:hypothetical protein
MTIPPTSRALLERAIQLFDRGQRSERWHESAGGWMQDTRHRYAISHAGRLYPMKEIIRLAVRAATDRDFSEFSGGRESVEYVKRYGLAVDALTARTTPPPRRRSSREPTISTPLRGPSMGGAGSGATASSNESDGETKEAEAPRDPNAQCAWLQSQLETLPPVGYPLDLNRLPRDGIYFFYEAGEAWGHGGDRPRIVRIGTHKDGNFRSRVSEHFGLGKERAAHLDRPSLKDRSIFRKNLGRALLNGRGDPYLEVWDLDLTTRAAREAHRERRDLAKEEATEAEITRLIRERFWFRFLILSGQTKRMGSEGLESALIGTVSRCSMCRPSASWLGRHSPKPVIRASGLWLVQHVGSAPLLPADEVAVSDALVLTRRWIDSGPTT